MGKKRQPETPPERELSPLFGVHCETLTFSVRGADKAHHFHFEAHVRDPVARTWEISKVTHKTGDADKTLVTVDRLEWNLSFTQALHRLAALEKQAGAAAENVALFQPGFMGPLHYRHFAEREGYVFDTEGKAHARPDPQTLPPGATFLMDDIAAAARNMERPANEFDGTGPGNKMPHTLFVIDHFSRAAGRQNVLKEKRVLEILDRYCDGVEQAAEAMASWCAGYMSPAHEKTLEKAENGILRAETAAMQLQHYGIDNRDFESFALQCRASCEIVHAMGLFEKMHNGDAQAASGFRAHFKKAAEALQKIDGADQQARELENILLLGIPPQVPEAMPAFVAHYRKLRPKNGAAPG